MGQDGVDTLRKKGAKWFKIGGSPGDNGIDKLNHVWTVYLLIIFALAVSKGQFFGDNIQCWAPAEFDKDSWVPYVKDYCWIKNTYFIPMNEPIPTDAAKREENEILYYQWVPLILIFQAALFKLPNMVWTLFRNSSGINLDKVLGLTEETQLVSSESREETIGHLAKYIDKWINAHRQYKWNLAVRVQTKLSRIFGFLLSKRTGTALSSLFLFVKFLFLVNVICQFFLLNAFLAHDRAIYGQEVLDKLRADEPWRENPKFPRITLCDFKIRQMQNIQPYTIQCVLPINLYNEKIFIFIWFWLLLLIILSAINFLHWAVLLLRNTNRANYAKKYLKFNNLLQSGLDTKLALKFANSYLRDDGVFILRIISNDSTEMVLSDIVTKLWKNFQHQSKTTSGGNDSEEEGTLA